jgi:Peptidase C13 family
VRNKVVVISACYSGVFIPHLANVDTLVITAADANHASFGCEDKAKWTYFGDAFFNVALRRATSLKEAFVLARSLVEKRELRDGFEPSRPQIAPTWSHYLSPALELADSNRRELGGSADPCAPSCIRQRPPRATGMAAGFRSMAAPLPFQQHSR